MLANRVPAWSRSMTAVKSRPARSYASLADLFGNGTISATQGAVVDANLNFDAAHGTQAQTTFGSGGTLKVTAAGGDLGVGYKGSGSLTVADGVQITSNIGYLAYNPGTTGTATVSGAGSKWTTNEDLNIGHRGTGSLTVDAGAKVASGSAQRRLLSATEHSTSSQGDRLPVPPAALAGHQYVQLV